MPTHNEMLAHEINEYEKILYLHINKEFVDRVKNHPYEDPNNPKRIKIMIDEVIKEAATNAMNAGYGGEMGDRGARALIVELAAFLHGAYFAITGRFSHKKFFDMAEKQIIQEDPEYKKYLELHKKYGHIK